MSRRLLLAVGAAVALAACGVEVSAPPDPETSAMEPAVRQRIAVVRAAVLEEPRSAEAWGRLGMVLHAHELFGDASAAYRTAAELDPDDERWPYFLAVVLAVEATDPAAAEAGFRRTLELRPGYAPAHLRLGDLLAAGDDLEGAEANYRRALELDPELAPAELGLGQVFLRSGRPAEAVERLERASAALPHSGAALQALGRAYLQVGRDELARATAERARDVQGFDLFSDPLMSQVAAEEVSTTLLWQRARQALADERFGTAIGVLHRIAAWTPSDPEVHEHLGLAYHREGRSALAAEHLRRALELDPERHRARARLGLLLAEAGEPGAAVTELARALEGLPADAELRAHLGRALAVAGRGTEALVEFETAAAITEPLPGWAYHEWGIVLAKQRRYGEAAERFERALALEPGNAQGLFHLGLALEGAGRPTEAVAVYRRAMEIEPNELIASRLRVLESVQR